MSMESNLKSTLSEILGRIKRLKIFTKMVEKNSKFISNPDILKSAVLNTNDILSSLHTTHN